ncbi:MAG: hypothetical protein OXG78_09670 [Chloroflexi bacterium]|nr:hypothetical protein [Chloroflexota bacterium]
MTEIRLPLPRFQYRFDLLLDFARRIAHPARLIVNGDTLWRFTAGYLLAYRQEGDAIIVSGKCLPPEDEERVIETSQHLLGLRRDLSGFYAAARADASLWPVVEPLVGLPIHCTETVFEALITLIIEQHITWKTALRSQRCLLRLFGRRAAIDGDRSVYDFPTPAQLASATREALQPLKITNKRIDLIIATAAAICRSELDLESIGDLPPKQAYEQLLELNGVGPWTATNVVGRAFGSYPFVSANDVALQAAVQRYFYAVKGDKGAAQVRDALERCGEHAGMAGHFVLLRWVMDNYAPATT